MYACPTQNLIESVAVTKTMVSQSRTMALPLFPWMFSPLMKYPTYNEVHGSTKFLKSEQLHKHQSLKQLVKIITHLSGDASSLTSQSFLVTAPPTMAKFHLLSDVEDAVVPRERREEKCFCHFLKYKQIELTGSKPTDWLIYRRPSAKKFIRITWCPL